MLIEQMIRWKKCAEENNVEQDIKDASDAIAYLERQKEQKPHWKPSEKQMEELEYGIGLLGNMNVANALRELYTDLKKL
jgi:hypothetical protein